MNLERDDDACTLRLVRELVDVREKGVLALTRRRVPADRRVHDRDPGLGREANGGEAVVDAGARRQLGMRAQTHGFEPVLGELRRQGIRMLEVDVLGPAGDSRQFHVPVTGLGDSRERLVEAVGVERVRVAGELIEHRRAILTGRRALQPAERLALDRRRRSWWP